MSDWATTILHGTFDIKHIFKKSDSEGEIAVKNFFDSICSAKTSKTSNIKFWALSICCCWTQGSQKFRFWNTNFERKNYQRIRLWINFLTMSQIASWLVRKVSFWFDDIWLWNVKDNIGNNMTSETCFQRWFHFLKPKISKSFTCTQFEFRFPNLKM